MIPKSSFESTGSSNWAISVQNGEAWPEGFENGNLRHCSTAAQHSTVQPFSIPANWGQSPEALSAALSAWCTLSRATGATKPFFKKLQLLLAVGVLRCCEVGNMKSEFKMEWREHAAKDSSKRGARDPWLSQHQIILHATQACILTQSECLFMSLGVHNQLALLRTLYTLRNNRPEMVHCCQALFWRAWIKWHHS